jgi:hypothetical protein
MEILKSNIINSKRRLRYWKWVLFGLLKRFRERLYVDWEKSINTSSFHCF